MTTTFGRNEFRSRWLYSINELTDYKLQNKSWLDTSNLNPHWSFVEFYCCCFDEVLADADYQFYMGQGWVSNREYDIIKDWHSRLDRYKSPGENDSNHLAILSDPLWIKLVGDGKDAKDKLATTLDANERPFLTSEIDYLKST